MSTENTGARFNANDIQNSLFEFYLPEFRENIKDPDKHYFMNTIKGNGYQKINGKYAVYGLRKGVQGGAGAISDSDNYKDPSTSGRERQIVNMKNLQVNSLIDLKTIAAGNEDGAFEDLLADEMATMLISAEFDRARQLFTTETGTIDTVKTLLTTEDFTTADGIVVEMNSANRFNIGYRVDIYSADGLTKLADELEIVDVDSGAESIVLEASDYTTITVTALTVPVGSLIINSVAKGKEITGLEQALTATGTYHGLDRATNRWYKPQIVDHSAALLTEAVLRKTKDRVDINAKGVANLMVSRHEVVAGYESLLTVNKRYTENNAMDLMGGYQNLQFDAQPFVKDRDSTISTVYGLNTNLWEKPTYKEWDFDDLDGNVFKFTAGPRYTFRMIEFCNLTTDTPRGNFRINNVLEQ